MEYQSNIQQIREKYFNTKGNPTADYAANRFTLSTPSGVNGQQAGFDANPSQLNNQMYSVPPLGGGQQQRFMQSTPYLQPRGTQGAEQSTALPNLFPPNNFINNNRNNEPIQRQADASERSPHQALTAQFANLQFDPSKFSSPSLLPPSRPFQGVEETSAPSQMMRPFGGKQAAPVQSSKNFMAGFEQGQSSL